MAERESLAINELVSPQNKRIRFGSAAPSAGAWLVGDAVINTAPAAAGYFGWVCTTAGTPGTWKGFGAIEA